MLILLTWSYSEESYKNWINRIVEDTSRVPSLRDTVKQETIQRRNIFIGTYSLLLLSVIFSYIVFIPELSLKITRMVFFNRVFGKYIIIFYFLDFICFCVEVYTVLYTNGIVMAGYHFMNIYFDVWIDTILANIRQEFNEEMIFNHLKHLVNVINYTLRYRIS